MADVHGIADLPGAPAPAPERRPRQRRPGRLVRGVRARARPARRPPGGGRPGRPATATCSVVHAGDRSWTTRTIVNATGTWTRPFVPHYPGVETFRGEQLHTVDYPGPEHFRGRRVLVVGGGASAVQLLGEIAPVADTVWVTRRPPVWRTDDFDREAGRAAVALVEERVRRGLPPASVVSVTGLALREQEREAERLGAYARRPMFDRIEPDGVRWADGSFEPVDVILWATGFRPAVTHLGPLHLRSVHGGIQLDGTTAVADPAGAAGRLRAVGEHDRRQPGRPGGRGRGGPAAARRGRLTRPSRLSRVLPCRPPSRRWRSTAGTCSRASRAARRSRRAATVPCPVASATWAPRHRQYAASWGRPSRSQWPAASAHSSREGRPTRRAVSAAQAAPCAGRAMEAARECERVDPCLFEQSVQLVAQLSAGGVRGLGRRRPRRQPRVRRARGRRPPPPRRPWPRSPGAPPPGGRGPRVDDRTTGTRSRRARPPRAGSRESASASRPGCRTVRAPRRSGPGACRGWPARSGSACPRASAQRARSPGR